MINHRAMLLLSWIAVVLGGCQSIASNCPVEAREQTSLLCAASGHYSGANAQRVENKKKVAAALENQNATVAKSKDMAGIELSTIEKRRDVLIQYVKNERVRLSDASKYLEKAKLAKSRNAAEFSRLEARIGIAGEQLRYLQTAPVDTNAVYNEQLEHKQQLESELDSLLEMLAE